MRHHRIYSNYAKYQSILSYTKWWTVKSISWILLDNSAILIHKKIKLIVITIAVALHSRKQNIVTINVYWLLEQMSEHEHSDVHGNLFLKQEHWLVLQSPLQPHLISSRIALGAGGIKQWVGRRTSLSLSFVQPFSVRGGSFNDYDDHKPKPKSI